MAMTQKTRSLVSLLALLVATTGLGLFAYYGVHRKQETEQQAKEQKARLFEAEASKIRTLTVTAKGQTTVLNLREDGQGWDVVSPVQVPADKNAVDSLIEQLLRMKSKGVVEQKSADLARYGLDKPMIKVVAKLQDGSELTLRSGAENQFDLSQYVLVGESSDVIQAEGGYRWALDKDTFDLRDKHVVPFQDGQASALEVRSEQGAFSLRKTEGKWRLVKPIEDRADQDTMERILNALRNLQATRFVTDLANPSEDQKHGLNPAKLTAQLTLESGAATTLELGQAELDGGKKSFARRKEATFIAEVPDSALADLTVTLADLRDKSLLSFEREKVRAVRFSFGEESLTAELSKGVDGGSDEWKVTQPQPGPAQKWKLSGLLHALGSLKAKGFAEENPADPSAFGLDKPSRSITLLAEDGKELAKLTLGAQLESLVYASGSLDRRVYLVEQSALAELPASAADVRAPAEPAPQP